MLKIIGIIGLIILFAICIPNHDKMSYKRMYYIGKEKEELNKNIKN